MHITSSDDERILQQKAQDRQKKVRQNGAGKVNGDDSEGSDFYVTESDDDEEDNDAAQDGVHGTRARSDHMSPNRKKNASVTDSTGWLLTKMCPHCAFNTAGDCGIKLIRPLRSPVNGRLAESSDDEGGNCAQAPSKPHSKDKGEMKEKSSTPLSITVFDNDDGEVLSPRRPFNDGLDDSIENVQTVSSHARILQKFLLVVTSGAGDG